MRRPYIGVLIVDDEPIVTSLVARVLRRSHTVEIAPDGEVGLDCARRLEIGMVLSDLRMPRLSGLGLLATLRHEQPELAARFAIMTGGGTPEEELALARAGVPVLRKPFGRGELTALVERWVPASARAGVPGPGPRATREPGSIA